MHFGVEPEIQSPKTVPRLRQNIKQLSMVGLEGPYGDLGPSLFYDFCGLETAVSILLDSQGKGIYTTSHKQWDTICKIRLTISIFERVQTNAPLAHLILVNEVKGTSQKFHIEGATSLQWTSISLQGMHNGVSPTRVVFYISGTASLLFELLS